jgi:hypothetical protein
MKHELEFKIIMLTMGGLAIVAYGLMVFSMYSSLNNTDEIMWEAVEVKMKVEQLLSEVECLCTEDDERIVELEELADTECLRGCYLSHQYIDEMVGNEASKYFRGMCYDRCKEGVFKGDSWWVWR